MALIGSGSIATQENYGHPLLLFFFVCMFVCFTFFSGASVSVERCPAVGESPTKRPFAVFLVCVFFCRVMREG